MWNRKRSVKLSIILCFAVCVLLTVALLMGPWFICQYWAQYVSDCRLVRRDVCFIVEILCFYLCAAFGYATLYSLLRLLFNIKNEKIFIDANVNYLRRISWCCIAVSVITLAPAAIYIPWLFLTVAAGFVGMMLRVVKNVMQNAVEIQAENELTI